MKIGEYIEFIKQADMVGTQEYNWVRNTVDNDTPATYASVDDFIKSEKPFMPGESIRMPQGQLFINQDSGRWYNAGKDPIEPAITVAKEIKHYAPFYTRKGNDYLNVYRGDGVGGVHDPYTGKIDYYIGGSLNPYGVYSHEPIHDFSTGYVLQNDNPYNITDLNGFKNLKYKLSLTNQYNTEQPTTSNEWGRVLMPFLRKQFRNEYDVNEGVKAPRLPMDWNTKRLTKGLSYGSTIQKMPYLYFKPQLSPFGFNHEITPEEWASWTVPLEYDPGTDSMREIPYDPEKSYIFNTSTSLNDTAKHLGLTDEIDSYAVPSRFQAFNQIAQSPVLGRYVGPTIRSWDDPKYNLVASSPQELENIAHQTPLEDPTDQIALYYFKRSPQTLEKELAKYPNLTEEQKATIIEKHKRLQELDANEREYFTQYALPLWIARHARRGINVVNGEVTPHAHLQGVSQQNDPDRRDEWHHIYRQVLDRCQDYKQNPYYIDVMRNWEMSPQGDGMLSEDRQPTITLEQMYEMLREFDEADKRFELENSEQMQSTPTYYQYYKSLYDNIDNMA